LIQSASDLGRVSNSVEQWAVPSSTPKPAVGCTKLN